MLCPRDRNALTTVVRDTPHGNIELDVCDRCHGVWFDRRELAEALRLDNLDAFAPDSPLLDGDRVSLPCPRNPHVRMRARHLVVGNDPRIPQLELDQCAECGGVWLDGGELPTTIAALKDAHVRPFLENHETAKMGSAALWLFMFFTGLPVEQWNPRVRRPVVMPLLVIACVLGFLWQLSGGETSLTASVLAFGLVPWRLFAGDWTSLVTYIFLHAGIAHLAGNMYFLWVFGDNVEDRLGRARFFFLFLGAGITAGLTHAVLSPDKSMPVVGASGAISGVMAAYAILFPRTRLLSLIVFFRVRWRASIYLFGWLALQVFGAFFTKQHIAWWAHIGGFAAGAAFAAKYRPQAPSAPSSIAQR
ncbi:MAG: rhomboid family intramembrane serine protease [Polyangia bacterium]